jgi:hypothetical protein
VRRARGVAQLTHRRDPPAHARARAARHELGGIAREVAARVRGARGRERGVHARADEVAAREEAGRAHDRPACGILRDAAAPERVPCAVVGERGAREQCAGQRAQRQREGGAARTEPSAQIGEESESLSGHGGLMSWL